MVHQWILVNQFWTSPNLSWPDHVCLVRGFKHCLISISYMGCHPSHWRTHIFQMVKTTNQFRFALLDGGGWFNTPLVVGIASRFPLYGWVPHGFWMFPSMYIPSCQFVNNSLTAQLFEEFSGGLQRSQKTAGGRNHKHRDIIKHY